MKRFVFALALLATFAYAADILTVDDVVKNAGKHDGKTLTVTGVVSDYQAKTSRAGNKYTILTLKGKEQTMNAYSRGHLEKAPKKGDTVEITGSFKKEKKVNASYTVKNEVDFTKGTDEKTKKYGLKIVKSAKS